MCSHVLSMLVCGLHGHCAVSRCALRVFMGSVFTCALHVSVWPTWSLCCVRVCSWVLCSRVLSMLVCGLHGRCAVSGCVHGFCVHVCSPCVRVCSTCVHVCYVHVCSPCVCSLWRQGSLSSVHWLKRLLRLQAFILRCWTQLRRGQGQTTILLWSHLFLLLFSCFLVTKVLSKIPFYFLYCL